VVETKGIFMLISCQNVSFGYEGQAVVRDISFTVYAGDYLWVVGENGSGKTTLIKGILKLLSPMEGSIVFCDELKKGRIGYLSQQSAPKKDFPAGVYEIVLSGNLSSMGLRPFYSTRGKRAAEEAMKQLGIENLSKKCYRELSGGQQRRVLLARALVSARAENSAEKPEESLKTSLLVLDEPTAGLDPLVTVEVYELLKTLNRQTGITIIMVSHDIRAAEQYANKILHTENGRGFFGETAEYLRSEMGRKFFSHGKEKNDDQHDT
jgi:zinc transport system ATP-binding protein